MFRLILCLFCKSGTYSSPRIRLAKMAVPRRPSPSCATRNRTTWRVARLRSYNWHVSTVRAAKQRSPSLQQDERTTTLCVCKEMCWLTSVHVQVSRGGGTSAHGVGRMQSGRERHMSLRHDRVIDTGMAKRVRQHNFSPQRSSTIVSAEPVFRALNFQVGGCRNRHWP